MKAFICNNCGHQLRRPSMPMRCEACGQARVGLFKLAPAPPSPAPQSPAPPGLQTPVPQAPANPLSPGGQVIAPPPPPGGAVAPPNKPGPGAMPAPVRPTMPTTPQPAAPAAPTGAGGLASPPPPGTSHVPAPNSPSPTAPSQPATSQPAPPTPAPGPAAPTAPTPPVVKSPHPPPSSPAPPAQKQSPPPPSRTSQPPKKPSGSDFASPPPGRSNTAKQKATKEHLPVETSKKSDAQPPSRRSERAKPATAKNPSATKQTAKKPSVKSEASTAAAPAGSTPGRVVWTYPRLVPGQDLDLQAQRGCVAIDGNRQILACLGKRLVALTEHEEEPRELWDYPTRGHIPGSPIVGRDGNIRIHSGDGMLHCVTPEGKKEFSAKVGEPLGWASPLVDNDDHTLISAYSGGLLKIDGKGTRANLPFFRTRQKLDSTGVIHHGVLYIGGEDAFVYALRLAGSRGRNEWNQDKNNGKTEWFINTAIAYHDGLFVVAGRDEYLYGFDEKGQQIWRVHLRGQMLGSPVIDAEGNVYVGVSLEQRGEESTGTMVCVKGTSQAISWEYDAGAAIESTPILGDDGVLYFGDNDGVVHAVDLDGRRQWTQNVGSPVRSAGAITPSGRVVFGADRGCLVALATSSSGLAKGGWPKFLGTPQQSGTTGRR